jgi:hypothetical protein
MSRNLVIAVAVLMGCLALTTEARAQYRPRPPSIVLPPPVSPYLSLALNNNNVNTFGINYYLGVVAERDRRRNEANLYDGILMLDRRSYENLLDIEGLSIFGPTGMRTYFQTTGRYYGFEGFYYRPNARIPTGVRTNSIGGLTVGGP